VQYDVLDLKAAMIGRIAEFVRWPREAGLEDPLRPFELVVLGSTPLLPRLTHYYSRVRIAGHRVYLRRAEGVKDIDKPHLLFIAANAEDEIPDALAALRGSWALSVGDTEGFSKRGLAVNLYVAEQRVRFEISRGALAAHKLSASYRLLSLARLVDEEQALR
jgi:hypothetical protein